jgi:hypothetical protein
VDVGQRELFGVRRALKLEAQRVTDGAVRAVATGNPARPYCQRLAVVIERRRNPVRVLRKGGQR